MWIKRALLTIFLVVSILASTVGVVGAVEATASASPSTTAAQLVFTTEPGDGSPGQALAAQPVVAVEDGSGNTLTADASTISLSINESTVFTPSGTTVAGQLSCSSSSSSVAASSGVATFDGCQVDRGGLYTLTATDTADNLTATSTTFFVTGPAQLVFTGQPGGGAASVPWDNQPQLSVEDAYGNVLTADATTIGVAVQGGTGAPGAAVACGTNPAVAAGGVASFSACSIASAGSGYELYGVDPTDELISAPSSAFDVSGGAATQLVFTTEPTDGAGGQPLTSQPVVSVEDPNGNAVTTNNDQITLAVTSGTGTAGAILSCSGSSSPTATAVNGVATFAGCSVDKSGTNYTLTATDSNGNLSAASTPFSVTSGAATAIRFAIQPGGGTGGTAWPVQPVVDITDPGGNLVPGSVALSIKTGPAGATLSCDYDPLSAASGIESFSGCSIVAQLHEDQLSGDALRRHQLGRAAQRTGHRLPGPGRHGPALQLHVRQVVHDSELGRSEPDYQWSGPGRERQVRLERPCHFRGLTCAYPFLWL